MATPPDPPAGLFADLGAPQAAAPRATPRRAGTRKPVVAAPVPVAAPAAAAPAAAVAPATGTPVECAWARVAVECPQGRAAAEHRAGTCYVHVVPLGHRTDVRCFPGEEVPGYSGFYRPRGGHLDLVPEGTPQPTDAELQQGARATPGVWSLKTDTYLMAEMTGRELG